MITNPVYHTTNHHHNTKTTINTTSATINMNKVIASLALPASPAVHLGLSCLDALPACSGRSLAAPHVAAALLDTRLRVPRLWLYPKGSAVTLARCIGPVWSQPPPWWGCWTM